MSVTPLAEFLEREQRLRKEANDRAGRLASQLDQTRASLTATKVAKTRFRKERDHLKTHAAAGVCPVPGCRRHFQNLQRHMHTKHPGYTAEALPSTASAES